MMVAHWGGYCLPGEPRFAIWMWIRGLVAAIHPCRLMISWGIILRLTINGFHSIRDIGTRINYWLLIFTMIPLPIVIGDYHSPRTGNPILNQPGLNGIEGFWSLLSSPRRAEVELLLPLPACLLGRLHAVARCAMNGASWVSIFNGEPASWSYE